MKFTLSLLVFIGIALTGVLSQAPTTTPKADPTTSAKSPTTAPTTKTTPTTKPTTPTTSPTTKPTTPTTKPTTPTTKPTAPTTKASPTTVPPTTPATPAASKNTYSVMSEDGQTMCIKMQAEISLDITYQKKDKSNATVNIAVPQNFTDGGNCGNHSKTQTLDILFFNQEVNKAAWKLTFTFTQDDKTDSHVSAVDLIYQLDGHFPDAAEAGQTMTATIKPSGKDYLKANENGYTCSAKLSEEGDKLSVTTQQLKVVAFNDKKEASFQAGAMECSADEDTNSIVPIAVGAALAGLVVIVLIAYLIGRKRTRKTGYETV